MGLLLEALVRNNSLNQAGGEVAPRIPFSVGERERAGKEGEEIAPLLSGDKEAKNDIRRKAKVLRGGERALSTD